MSCKNIKKTLIDGSFCPENAYLCRKLRDMSFRNTLFISLLLFFFAVIPATAQVEQPQPTTEQPAVEQPQPTVGQTEDAVVPVLPDEDILQNSNLPDVGFVGVEQVQTIDPLDTLLAHYMNELDALVLNREFQNQQVVSPELDAYYYRLMTPGTLYASPVHSVMSTVSVDPTDEKQLRLEYINRALAQIYGTYPTLIQQTQGQLAESGVIREDMVKQTFSTDSKLSETVAAVDLGPSLDEDLVLVTRRPNFWKTNGNLSLNFTQNYASKKWGNNNVFSGATVITLNANYNNLKKITLTNNMNIRVGFQTDKNDKMRAFRPSTNAADYTGNLAYKISKYWNYSLNVRLATQVVPSYVANTDKVNTDFLSPLNVTVGPGLTSTFAWGKKNEKGVLVKGVTGSLSMAPLAYNVVYVQRDALVTNYGVRAGHHSRHSFGPTITISSNWPINKTITWINRMRWYSNLHTTTLEWENTFRFVVSKLITAQLHFYPRFDDSGIAFKNEHGNYLMLKEDMSLGLAYAF